MPPPPAQGIASSFLLAPALKVQPDRRLVDLVRDGYETAFEEIVRRYASPLRRYAAAIVPSHRAEDVTQDAFSKALLALRRDQTEIELRPWLYRIVRNTALNDLRDEPKGVQPLSPEVEGQGQPPELAEKREEMNELIERLQALPEPQRAAIVMRELEGLSHEEIAATMGVTGGAARQFIYRARVALRDGVGLMIPLPVLKALIDHGAAGAATATAGGGAVAAGASLGGGGALKVGVLTAMVAGSIGAGVAAEHHTSANRAAQAAVPAGATATPSGTKDADSSATASAPAASSAPGSPTGAALSGGRSVGSAAAPSSGRGSPPESDQAHDPGHGRGDRGVRAGPPEPPDASPGSRGGHAGGGPGPRGDSGPDGQLGQGGEGSHETPRGNGHDSGSGGEGGEDSSEAQSLGDGSGPGPRSGRLEGPPDAPPQDRQAEPAVAL